MMNNKNRNNSNDRSPPLSPSADGILDVTPVSTFEYDAQNDSYEVVEEQTEVSLNYSRIEDDDGDGDDNDDSEVGGEGDEQKGKGGSRQKRVAASSSASEKTTPYNPWDNVLKSGKPSEGRVSKFFNVRTATTGSSYDSDGISSPTRDSTTGESAVNRSSFDSSAKKQQQQQSSHPLSPKSGAESVTSTSRKPPQSPSNKPPTAPPRASNTSSTTTATTTTNNTQSTAASSTIISVHSNVRPSPSTTTSHSQQKQLLPQQQPRKPTAAAGSTSSHGWGSSNDAPMRPHSSDDLLSSGVLPDVLMTMRLNLESLALFDSDMMRITAADTDTDPTFAESRESLKRSSQQSISAAVLVSLAHKRYERRRLAAMEIEKVVRSLVHQNEIDRVRAILLLLSDDYVRSTSEDARKGGVVALAACAIGLKKANGNDPTVQECRDLILASVVHACQDHSQRVRYYATESLFNVVKVVPSMAVQHFFILFEILRSLYADVDIDVRSGAELLDRKLKEVIVGAINAGTFTAEDCIPVFARFVYMRNKATKRLTLTWLQELNEKLVTAPILEFLHLFLGGIFDMIADPTQVIRQSALAFLHSVLPKLLVANTEMDNNGRGGDSSKTGKVDFDKILQSLVTTMEHPDPFVRKVAMYWMSRIVRAHVGETEATKSDGGNSDGGFVHSEKKSDGSTLENLSPASLSVRNSLPHILPGILLSIGDDFYPRGATKDSFLPDQTTRALAEQTNTTLQNAVRRDGQSYVPHLDGFIVALREELDSPGGLNARNPPAIERTPYRMDVNQDGTGIESPGWFSSSGEGIERTGDSMIMSRLCALDWVIVLYESVVPVLLKADYALEFVFAIIHQLVDNPPEIIVYKSLEVLARITVPVPGEDVGRSLSSNSLSGLAHPVWLGDDWTNETEAEYPMTEPSVTFALELLETPRKRMMSRNREVFSALIQLHSFNQALLENLAKVITYMCKLQPPEFVFVAFSVELDRFIVRREAASKKTKKSSPTDFSRDLKFVSSFVQNMSHVLLNTGEAKPVRDVLKDCVCSPSATDAGRQKTRLFHILLHSFTHNMAATVSLCFWVGAYRTTTLFLKDINPLDINLMFLLEIDRFVEMLERPLFRHLHVRMVERDKKPFREGSGTMLFQALKSLLMMLPQSTCYSVLRDRLTSVSRFRQSAIGATPAHESMRKVVSGEVDAFVARVKEVRRLHCAAAWKAIRAESLMEPPGEIIEVEEGSSRIEWLGYASKKEAQMAQEKYNEEKKQRQSGVRIEEIKNEYHEFPVAEEEEPADEEEGVEVTHQSEYREAEDETTTGNQMEGTESVDGARWKGYWAMDDQ